MLSRSLDNRDMLLSTATGRARIGCAEGVNYSAVTTGRHEPTSVVPGVVVWSGALECTWVHGDAEFGQWRWRMEVDDIMVSRDSYEELDIDELEWQHLQRGTSIVIMKHKASYFLAGISSVSAGAGKTYTLGCLSNQMFFQVRRTNTLICLRP